MHASGATHAEHVPWFGPQAVSAVPGWHVVPSQQPVGQTLAHVPLLQQPPLQITVGGLHAEVHVPPLQAFGAAQFADVVQPHAPLMQACPLALVVQSEHVLEVPQAAAAVPTAHVPPLQQPPLQIPGLQAVVHTPPLHAVFAGQSLEVTQPHVPDGQT
jgi:hypothetical protein